MSELTLNVETRESTGTRAVKKLRREEKIPAIYYIHGQKNIPVIVDRKELHAIWGHHSSLLNVVIDGKKAQKAIIREIQFDPIKGTPIHIDFLGIKMGEKVKVAVALHLVGTPEGVRTHGGVLQHLMREIEIECLPSDIPEAIEVDVTALNIGDSLRVSDISIEKAEILLDPDTNLASVIAPRVAIEDEESGDATAEPEVLSQKSDEE